MSDFYNDFITERNKIDCPHGWSRRRKCVVCEQDDDQLAIEAMLKYIAELEDKLRRRRG